MLCSELLGNFSDVSSSATRLSLSAIGKRIYVKWMNGSEKNGVATGCSALTCVQRYGRWSCWIKRFKNRKVM